MDDKLKDHRQFKMRLDSEPVVEESPITSQVDELRMEKLNQRVTIISILIPVLIVVILVIAYLDIKQRVIRTEDTGVSGVENLSKDVESRFSTLSLRQAKLEELLKTTADTNNASLAKIQVNLKKLEDRVKKVGKGVVSKKDLSSKIQPIDRKIANLSASIDECGTKSSEMNRQLQSTLAQLNETVTNRENQITQLQEKITALDQSKIDKSALDLAMKLELLKIKQTLQSQMSEIEDKIQQLQTKINARQTVDRPPSQAPTSPAPAPKPQQPAVSDPQPDDQPIKEQPIQ